MDAFKPTQYVEVWLPLALPKPLTYAVPGDDKVEPGFRVIVPLKGKKLYTGLVWNRVEKIPEGYEPRPVIEVVDKAPFLSSIRMKFLEWMAGYYLCSIGEVLIAAIPSAFRASSESYAQIHPDYEWEISEAESEWFWLFTALNKNKKLALSDVAKAIGPGKNWMKIVRRFQEEGKILLFDELSDHYKPRTQTWLELAEKYQTDDALDALFASLESKPEEETLLLRFLSKTRFTEGGDGAWQLMKEDFPLKEPEKKTLDKLLRKGILIRQKKKTDPFGKEADAQSAFSLPDLSPAQSTALEHIRLGLEARKPVLLMGITGSGKTELYIHLIREKLEKQQQCLLLLPEIAITVHIVHRLRKIFGHSMGVYHSRATPTERLEVWEGVESGKLKLVIGARSALFLPWQNPGLLLVDEEHDASYKQQDPAPRYHGRDAGIFLFSLWKADIVLGSATPSVESYFKAQTGKWELVRLFHRFGEAQLPEIRYVDLKVAERTLNVKLDIATEVLEQFKTNQEKGRQSILFQNRRGYAPYMQCKDCGWIPYCPSCDVSLTLHQSKKSLNCHYCGYQSEIPGHCFACGSVQLESHGYGTEKLEESLEILFPDFKIARMDQDTTQSRKSYEQILRRMAHGEIDILVGTQMVTKGLDFENVTFVSVFDIDRILFYPDYRANERAYQLLTQISGRAGRRSEKGLVLVQTRKPNHPVYQLVQRSEPEEFYAMEINHRQTFEFPPFCRLIRITARHKEELTARTSIEILCSDLQKKLGSQLVLGPEAPAISRIRNLFLFHLMIKIPENSSLKWVKEIVQTDLRWIQSLPDFRQVQWIADVDPN
jgi:primosomal protein N' (replication factor Y)